MQDELEAKDDAPDYVRGVSVASLPYIVVEDGYINVAIAAVNGSAILYDNGTKIGHATSNGSSYYSMISGQYRVKKNDVISQSGGRLQWLTFFPLTGGGN